MKLKNNLQNTMTSWESCTLLADGHYHQGEFKQASKLFSKSVDLIEPWLDKEEKESVKVMHLFVLACHNTAHSLSRQGKDKEAEYYYSHAHFRLLSLISRSTRCTRVMDHALGEIKTTLSQLKQYLLSMNKIQLAGNIQQESVRVLQMFYADDVLTV